MCIAILPGVHSSKNLLTGTCDLETLTSQGNTFSEQKSWDSTSGITQLEATTLSYLPDVFICLHGDMAVPWGSLFLYPGLFDTVQSLVPSWVNLMVSHCQACSHSTTVYLVSPLLPTFFYLTEFLSFKSSHSTFQKHMIQRTQQKHQSHLPRSVNYSRNLHVLFFILTCGIKHFYAP